MLGSHPVGPVDAFARRALNIESWEFVPRDVFIALLETDYICLWVIIARACHNSNSVRGELGVFWANPDPGVEGKTGTLSCGAKLAYLFLSVISDDGYVSVRFEEPRRHWLCRHWQAAEKVLHKGWLCSNRMLLQPKRT